MTMYEDQHGRVHSCDYGTILELHERLHVTHANDGSEKSVDELKKKVSGRLKVLRCLAGRSWGRSPSLLRSLYCTYVQSCILYCASSWLVSTAANHLRKLESQHLAGARIITGCTRSTPTVPLLKEAALLPLAINDSSTT